MTAVDPNGGKVGYGPQGQYQAGGQIPGSGPQLVIAHGGEVVYNPEEPAMGLAALAKVLPDAGGPSGPGIAAGGPGGLSGGDAQITVNINMSSGDLVDLIHQGFLQKQIRTPLGIKS